MWTAETEEIQNGRRIQICRDGQAISFRSYLVLMETDEAFCSWYTELLAGTDDQAFFWEHPPICNANIDLEAEFVLLESPTLAKLRPDPTPFRAHFRDEHEIASFWSLGGDALLIAPGPTEPLTAGAHLAAFVREAPEAQIQSLWHETGRAVKESLSDRNLWLSTSGLGVAWLHIRLDSYPKYYQYRPYAATEGPFGLR